MTTAEQLRALVKEATPGPWYPGWTPGYLMALQDQHVKAGHAQELPLTLRSDSHTEEIATVWNYLLPTSANARLIALAPQLAELVADMLNKNSLDDALAALREALEEK